MLCLIAIGLWSVTADGLERLLTSELSFLSVVIKGSYEDNDDDGHEYGGALDPAGLALVLYVSAS